MSITDSAAEQNANSGEAGQANSPDNSQSEVISALEERLKNAEGQLNSLRSDKDKGITQTNQRLSDFEKRQEELVTMQSYLKEYGTPEKAARAMSLDALLQAPADQVPAQNNPEQTPPAGEGAPKTEEDNLVPLLGVDPADPEFVKLRATGLSPNDVAIQLASKRKGITTEVTDPNQASGVAGTGGGGAAGDTQQSVLEQEYQAKLKTIKQGDWREVAHLKDEFRGKGLEKY